MDTLHILGLVLAVGGSGILGYWLTGYIWKKEENEYFRFIAAVLCAFIAFFFLILKPSIG